MDFHEMFMEIERDLILYIILYIFIGDVCD